MEDRERLEIEAQDTCDPEDVARPSNHKEAADG